MFDMAGCTFHNGVIIIEVVDHRKPKADTNNNVEASKENAENKDNEPVATGASMPTVKRIEMKPDAQSIWNDICLLNDEANLNLAESEALNIESKLVVCYHSYIWLVSGMMLTLVLKHSHFSC